MNYSRMVSNCIPLYLNKLSLYHREFARSIRKHYIFVETFSNPLETIVSFGALQKLKGVLIKEILGALKLNGSDVVSYRCVLVGGHITAEGVLVELLLHGGVQQPLGRVKPVHLAIPVIFQLEQIAIMSELCYLSIICVCIFMYCLCTYMPVYQSVS